MNAIDLLVEDTVGVLHGHWKFELFDVEGNLMKVHEQDNLIVDTGKVQAMKNLFGLTGAASVVGMALGTNSATALAADTLITGAVYKAFDATPTLVVATRTVTCSTTYTTAEGNIVIREVGLLTGSGLVLFNRIVTSAITKDAAMSLKITVTITQG